MTHLSTLTEIDHQAQNVLEEIIHRHECLAVISQETRLIFQENENNLREKTQNVRNRSVSMREIAIGDNLHKILQ